ncbi:MAG: kynureninase [bacterium]|nr:MAG: kynureninase [bacterium]
MRQRRFETDREYAEKLDREDPLRSFRSRFHIPTDTIYLDGNSLGLLSHDTERTLHRVLGEWRTLGIRGWLEGTPPWFYFAERLGETAAGLVGALPEEVVATGTTTLNIHALVGTLYRPEGGRTKILAGALDFPTDIYALKSQIELRGLDSTDHLVLVPSSDGRLIDEETIVSLMTDEIALILLPSVLYRSGQLLDIGRLTGEARRRGICIGFDCSHSVGAVPHRFDDDDVDFAVWCSYKYLNGGPGSPAFLYLNKRHFGREPALAGWFGYVKERQFDMSLEFEHARSAGGWQISSPSILGSTAVEGALNLIIEAGLENIRSKSLAMTSYLIHLVDSMLTGAPYGFSIGTPREPGRRGGHVALERGSEAMRINEALKARGVIPDFRPPNIIRIAPVALYNTYGEVWQLVHHLREIIDGKEYERFSGERGLIP